MKKKILFAATSEGIQSGASRCYLGIVKELLKNNINFVSLVPKKGPMVEELNKLGVKTYVVYDFNGVWQVEKDYQMTFLNRIKYCVKFVYNQFAVNRIKNILIKEKIDLVHINSITRNSAALAAIKAGIPYVWHIRELLEDQMDSKFVNYSFAAELLRSADRLICISKTVNDYYIDKYNFDNTCVISDGVSVHKFYINRDIFSGITIKIGIIGRVEKQKRQDVFVKAIIKLANHYKNIKCFVIGQYNDDDYYNSLKDLIQKNGLNEKIEFTGFVSDSEKYLKECDIICPCSFSEAFGLVTIESMLSGCLVIASDSGCNIELVTNKQTGYLFKCDDYDDLFEKLIYAINNRDSAKEIAKKGQSFALSFSEEENVNKIINCYKEVLRG